MIHRVSSCCALLLLVSACTSSSRNGGLDPAPTLTGVRVAPDTASVVAGDSLVLDASALWSDGSTSDIPVSWASTGGTMSASGVYHAGTTAGSYMVIATTADFQHADTARVTVSDTGSAVTLSHITIAPDSLAIDAGATAPFSVLGTWSDGHTGSVPASWSATGGTITPGGSFHAGAAAGRFRVVATAASAVADTAVVTVRDTTSPVVLTGLVVAPATTTVDPGSTTLFAATGQYSDGSSAAVTATWSATGGTISPTGSYLAGSAAGSFRVVASSAAFADTALVTIRDTSTTTGGTVLFREAFDAGSVASRGWYDNTSPVITTQEHHTGAGALQMAFQAGGTIPVNGGSVRHAFTATDRFYVRYWVKYSANWVGSGVAYHPHEFNIVTNLDPAYVGPSATHMTAYVEHLYQNGGIPRLNIQDALNIDSTRVHQDLSNITEARAAAGCNGNTDGYATQCYQSGTRWANGKEWLASQPAFMPNPGPGYKNDWHQVEAYFQLNSIQAGKGQNDGVVQYWFDGQLLIDHHDVLLRTAANPTMQFNQFLIAPYIGVGSPVAQTMWIDDLVVATGKVP